MKSKWLEFILYKKGKKTDVWKVENKKGEILGVIRWYPKWRQYCFATYHEVLPSYDVVYAQGCLRDIAQFIKEQMDKRKK